MSQVLSIEEVRSKLFNAESTLARLLNRLPGMAYRCRVTDDFQYRLEFASKGCEGMIGIPPEEYNSNYIEQMMPDADRTRVRSIMKNAILAGKAYKIYYRIIMPETGQDKWIWDQGEGLYDDKGNCVFVEGIMMDVTEQKSKELSLKAENRKLRLSIKDSYGLGKIIGKSAAMQRCYRLLLKAAQSDTNVALYGETGVGKELAARTMHELSSVKGRFVPVNCAAIPDQLLESEFFGYMKGAFSGAAANHSGYLAAANGGTLFLDEVGELPLRLQGKLLRALESRTYTPVGSSDVRHSDFRLVCATNRSLEEMVRRGEMRSDFYYRIHVLPIYLPALRERLGDIPLLVDAYARTRGVTAPLPAPVLMAMEQYTWPGNVRELQNALDRYWAFGEMGLHTNVLHDTQLLRETQTSMPMRSDQGIPSGSGSPASSPAFSAQAGAPAGWGPAREAGYGTSGHSSSGHGSSGHNAFGHAAPTPPAAMVGIPLKAVRDEQEKMRILAVLEQCGWKKGQSAELLGITMRTLQRKLKRYGLAKRT